MEKQRIDWDPTTRYKDVEIAEKYDHVRFSRLTGRIFNALEKHNIRKSFEHVPRDSTVLDLPCGTGRLAEVLLDSGFKVIGVDISPAMLEVARRRLKRFDERFETRVEDVMELSKRESKQYDVALCARVLMHFPLHEQTEFLKAVALLTRGRVVFTQSLNSPYQRFRRTVKRWIGNPPSAAYPITESDLRALLAGAGLREIRRLRPMALLTEEIIVIAEPV